MLTDDRAGNRTQAVGLAEALGAPYHVKDLRFGLLSRLHNWILGASAAGLDRRSRALMVPPWPRLVIAAGRRTAPVARWIKRESGRRSLIVQLGRKGGQDPRPFDAVVTPIHTGLPGHPKRIETLVPLNRVSDDALGAAAAAADPFDGGPRPHVALLVGGATARQMFDAAAARRLGVEVARSVRRASGTLVAVTSRRTGPIATDALAAGLGDGGKVLANDPVNPYLACLGRADVIVVTGDSESMIAEATATGKAVYIYRLEQKPRGRWLRLGAMAARLAGARRAGRLGVGPWLGAYLIDNGIVRPPRDMALMHSGLESEGFAKMFDGVVSDRPPAERIHETEEVAETLRALLNLSRLDGV